MRPLLSFLSFAMVAVILGGGALCLREWSHYTAPGPLKAETTFIIDKGQGVSAIARNLKDQQIIEDPFLFRFVARMSGSDKTIKAGEYNIPAHASIRDIMGKMARGEVVQHRVTVREGLTSWQVVELLKTVPELQGDVVAIPAEGTLLPDTYQFARGDSRQSVLDQMKQAMDKAVQDLWAQRDTMSPLTTPAEAVVMASIVEKETGVADERARIAGVFENRLKRGIALQSDPTVIYALTSGKIQDQGKGPIGRRLLRKDLDIDSPYNTYRHAGLPPGPIANPGIDALKAVMKPEVHDFLYFVADGSGGHVFARTLKEHNDNVADWRKIRKKKKD